MTWPRRWRTRRRGERAPVDENDDGFAITLVELLQALELVEQAHVTDLELRAARLTAEQELVGRDLARRTATTRTGRAHGSRPSIIGTAMDSWPHLPPIKQLPLPYRAWAWWLRNGPRRGQGTIGGSELFRLLSKLGREEHAFLVLRADDRPDLTIDLRDFESFHHTIPVWFRGDEVLAISRAVMSAGGTYVDVGANYGSYALGIARMKDVRVIAVEPQPHLVEALRSSQRSNGFANLEIVEAALDAKPGTIALAVGIGSGSASVIHARLAPDVRKIDVASRTLDELAQTHDIQDLRCLKIDVEGAELSVLRGGLSVLARHRPVVIFEASRADPQNEVFALLRGAGYSEFWDQSTVASSDPVAPRLDDPLTNVIAVPSSDVDRIREMLRPHER